jgi:hypothetical protein
LKVTYEYDNKTFVQELLKILRSYSRKYAVKIENFEKKIHGRVKILGWSKKQHGTFCGSKLLADSKNVQVLYVSRSNIQNMQIFGISEQFATRKSTMLLFKPT